MLSDDLANLALYFREHEIDGVTLTPEAVRQIAAALADAVLRAGALERLTVPTAGRLALDTARVPRDPEPALANVLPFSPNVVPLPARVPRTIDTARVPRDPEPAA